jgi:large subunit ribosomal protein L18
MGLKTVKKKRAQRRVLRVRHAIASNGSGYRVSVFRSLKNIYVQLIDDTAGKTLVSGSSLLVKTEGDKTAMAFAVGKELAQKIKELDIQLNAQKIAFDRGSCRYHGRVKALAEGLREGGLRI